MKEHSCFYSTLYFCCVLQPPPPPPSFRPGNTCREVFPRICCSVHLHYLYVETFHIMKNYQPLDSCPDVHSFQLHLGNQVHRRKDRGVWMASMRVLKRTTKCSFLKNLFSLLSAGVNAVKTIFSWADGVKSVISSGDPIQSLYLKNLSNLSANGASEWKSEMERDRRERRRQNAKTASLLMTFIHSITKHVLRQKSTAAGKIMSM